MTAVASLPQTPDHTEDQNQRTAQGHGDYDVEAGTGSGATTARATREK